MFSQEASYKSKPRAADKPTPARSRHPLSTNHLAMRFPGPNIRSQADADAIIDISPDEQPQNFISQEDLDATINDLIEGNAPHNNIGQEELDALPNRLMAESKASTLPISDLVDDAYNPNLTAEQLSRSEALSLSRHNPDFRARNRPKTSQIRDMLSQLYILVLFATRSEDQSLLNDIYKRVKTATHNLPPLPQLPSPLRPRSSGNRGDEADDRLPVSSVFIRVQADDYWTAKHAVKDRAGSDVGSVGEMSDTAMEDLQRERGWWVALENYHAKIARAETESQDTTLVEPTDEEAGEGAGGVKVLVTPATPERPGKGRRFLEWS